MYICKNIKYLFNNNINNLHIHKINIKKYGTTNIKITTPHKNQNLKHVKIIKKSNIYNPILLNLRYINPCIWYIGH